MGSFATKSTVENYLNTAWTTTPIQWETEPFDRGTAESWISVKYIGVSNERTIGRDFTNAQLQVLCIGRNSKVCHTLADSVSSILSCHQISDIEIRVGQVQGSAINLENGFFALMVTFEVNNHS